ncbi:MAG: hypothetical protein OXH15_02375 [Gammaproteobacteria bacterium]|nr:hypothetical protein [Gammaproteobacteria bacterium]
MFPRTRVHAVALLLLLLAGLSHAQEFQVIRLDVDIVKEAKACAPNGYNAHCRTIDIEDLKDLTKGSTSSQSFELNVNDPNTIPLELDQEFLLALNSMDHRATDLDRRYSAILLFHLDGAFSTLQLTRLENAQRALEGDGPPPQPRVQEGSVNRHARWFDHCHAVSLVPTMYTEWILKLDDTTTKFEFISSQ